MTTPHHHEQDDVTVREIPKLRYGAIGWVVLALFLAAPEWTIWTTNWFINKLFVLLCFGLMLPYLVARRHTLQPITTT